MTLAERRRRYTHRAVPVLRRAFERDGLKVTDSALLERLAWAVRVYRLDSRSAARERVPLSPSESKAQHERIRKGATRLRRLLAEAHPSVRGRYTLAWERFHRGRTWLEFWEEDLARLVEATATEEAAREYRARTGPKILPCEVGLLHRVAFALHAAGFKLTTYTDGKAARYLRVLYRVATERRLPADGATLRLRLVVMARHGRDLRAAQETRSTGKRD